MRQTRSTHRALTLLGAVASRCRARPGAGPRDAASKWTSIVKVARCSRALDEAVFHGKMRRVEDRERMAMRFTLLERTGAEGFLPVPAPKLGRWHRSRAGVRAFGYKQSVRNLAGGASTACAWTTAGTTRTARWSSGRASAPRAAATRCAPEPPRAHRGRRETPPPRPTATS